VSAIFSQGNRRKTALSLSERFRQHLSSGELGKKNKKGKRYLPGRMIYSVFNKRQDHPHTFAWDEQFKN
jgi:hypothetical protein